MANLQRHPAGNFEEKTWKQQQSMNKAFWSQFKHFGKFLGKQFSVRHSQQDWWKSSQPARCTYNLQPDLLGSFPADVCPHITGYFGCGHRAKFSPSVGEGWGGGEDDKKLGGDRGFWQIGHSSYSRHQIPSETLHCLFSRSTFLPRTYYFFQISQPAKMGLYNRYFEEQIQWVSLNMTQGKNKMERTKTIWR